MEKDDKLVQYISRIENLEDEKKSVCDDIRQVYSELKGEGYDVKAVRQVIKLKKMMPADRAELNFLVQEYAKQIGIVEE
jgi:uncharacterized protein (UPF0335 family)